jgi:Bacterial regulatory helix-turn-helix protein, lysR family
MLRTEYLTWHRSLDDIAAQIGCPIQAVNRYARDHGIPVRIHGTSSYIPAGSAPGTHPRDLPEPLRSALTGRRTRQRLDHLLISAGHASIRQAAQALGLWPSALYDQIGRTERACGGPLVNRSPRQPRPQPAGHARLSLTLASRAGNCPSACAMAKAS